MRLSSLLLGLLLSTFLFLGGCGDAKIDASSEGAFKKSMEEMSQSLDETKRQQFESSVQSLMLAKVMMSPGDFADEAAAKKKIREVFDGKTVDQIIAEGTAVQADAKKDMEKMTR